MVAVLAKGLIFATAVAAAGAATTCRLIALAFAGAAYRCYDGEHSLYGRAAALAAYFAVFALHRAQFLEGGLALGAPIFVDRHCCVSEV